MVEEKKIVATIFMRDLEKVKKEVEECFTLGADIVEIRIDSFESPFDAIQFFDLIPKYPLIFSGNRQQIDKKELKVLLKAQELGALIDLPYFNYFTYPKNLKKKLILSYHGKIESFGQFQKNVIKMSFYSKFIKIIPPKENIFRAAQFLKWISRLYKKYHLIAFPSGEESKFARILSLAYGSNFVYCLSPNSEKTLPGQIDINELNLYYPKEITRNTVITGLLGYPLEFTLSPEIWNYWFYENNIDARYLPFVSREIQNALEAFKVLKVSFFGVTAPHKNTIVQYLNKMTNNAEKSSSVNTVLVTESGFYGFNTDIYGIKRATSFLPNGLKVLILGSGGTARSAIFSLKNNHQVVLSSRDEFKGKSFSKEFGIDFALWEEKENYEYDLIVNTTSIGSDNKLVPWNIDKPLKSKYLLEMVVPSQGKTPFEKFAEENGVKTINGKIPLYLQAKIQYKLFKKFLNRINL